MLSMCIYHRCVSLTSPTVFYSLLGLDRTRIQSDAVREKTLRCYTSVSQHIQDVAYVNSLIIKLRMCNLDQPNSLSLEINPVTRIIY